MISGPQDTCVHAEHLIIPNAVTCRDDVRMNFKTFYFCCLYKFREKKKRQGCQASAKYPLQLPRQYM